MTGSARRRGRYKIIFTDSLGCCELSRRRKSLSAAFGAAQRLLAHGGCRDVKIVDFNTGKVWQVSN